MEVLKRPSKLEKAALQNRQRVQNHRRKKKLKLESDTSQSAENVEEINLTPGIFATDGNSSSTDFQIKNMENSNGEVSNITRRADFISDDENSDGSGTNSESSKTADCFNNCSIAGTSFGDKIRKWASKDVAFSKVTELLKILNEHHPEIPKSTKTLFKSDLNLSDRIRKFNVLNPLDTSEYVYFGIVCHLIKVVNIALHAENILRLKINVDGMTPFKSSPLNFWPILGLVHHECATYKPFVIAAYYGRGKPYSVHVYLDEFIKELNHLCREGITIAERKFEVTIKCFCCDKPARSFLKCVVNHGAYYACERCWVPGFQYLGRMVYPLRDWRSRTDQSFRERENLEHHDGWFADDSKTTRSNRAIGSLRLKNLVGQVPKELQRVTRDLNNLSLLKAKDFRLLLLYCAPLVFKGVISEDEYKHFMLLHVACRILHSKDLINKFGDYTRMFLHRFVLLCEHIYGLEFVFLNPHILSHLYEDVVNMGCSVTYLDAFIFEGYLSELKKSLRSGNRPLAQLCQKVEFDLELNSKKATSNVDLLILNHSQSQNLYHVSSLKYLNFELTTSKPDNVILMKNGCILEIKDMVCSSLQVDAAKLYVLGEKLQILGSAYDYPVPSSALSTYSVKRGEDCEIFKFPLCELSCKMMLCEIFEFSTDEKELFAIPLLKMVAS
ncbi:hypothetical protein QAD02_011622 [Eretmocerus hayati]|uniref:Uncharacterized protein n=1 Tax=Eretmocerus hayati TaxID=131215 RepID=A0ACC2NZ14_9HYME|nr:hypothetical protein QAD02_011622 [Eretmocerus hayati]